MPLPRHRRRAGERAGHRAAQRQAPRARIDGSHAVRTAAGRGDELRSMRGHGRFRGRHHRLPRQATADVQGTRYDAIDGDSPAKRCSSPAASRGIGLAIALPRRRATAPTSPSPPRRPSRTRSCPAPSTRRPRRSKQAGGRALPSSSTSATRQGRGAVDAGVARFGGIDILVNNASAISLTGTLRRR